MGPTWGLPGGGGPVQLNLGGQTELQDLGVLGTCDCQGPGCSHSGTRLWGSELCHLEPAWRFLSLKGKGPVA